MCRMRRWRSGSAAAPRDGSTFSDSAASCARSRDRPWWTRWGPRTPASRGGAVRGGGPRAAVAGVTSYIASLAGRPRRELDLDVPAEVAGERRLGRGLASVCLGWYRWAALSFAEALPPDVCAALADAGVADPSALRLRLFYF